PPPARAAPTTARHWHRWPRGTAPDAPGPRGWRWSRSARPSRPPVQVTSKFECLRTPTVASLETAPAADGRDARECSMPTVLRSGSYRFFFYSLENDEPPHIHVECGD